MPPDVVSKIFQLCMSQRSANYFRLQIRHFCTLRSKRRVSRLAPHSSRDALTLQFYFDGTRVISKTDHLQRENGSVDGASCLCQSLSTLIGPYSVKFCLGLSDFFPQRIRTSLAAFIVRPSSCYGFALRRRASRHSSPFLWRIMERPRLRHFARTRVIIGQRS
jgi:hypothetical protein